jgi:cell division protein ZipA
MTPGEMSIYHRLDPLRPAGVPLFSLANMLNPGVFPFQDMEEFKTPGLAMFTQLPGPQDGQVVFAEMLRTAEEIALQLGGELNDETHSVHIKSEIVEHRRKLQLAKRRPK